MNDNTYLLARTAVALCLTYCIHSTLLISAAWLMHRIRGIHSHALSERMWRLAASLGLVTASLQMSLTSYYPGMKLSLRLEPFSLAEQGQLADSMSSVPSRSSESKGRTKDRVSNRLDQPLGAITSGAADVLLPPSTNQSLTQRDKPAAKQYSSKDPHPSPTSSEVSSPAALAIDDLVTRANAPRHLSESTDSASTRLDSAAQSTIPQGAEIGAGALPLATSRWSPGQLIVNAFAALLAVVIGAGLFLLVIQSISMQRRFACAKRLKAGRSRRILDRLLGRCQLRRQVQVIESQCCSEPVSYGLFRWTIALPVGLAEQLSNNELRALFAHELAHLSRGDVRWLWIGRVLCGVLSFQPLNRVARRRWQQASEFCCDDWAIERGQTRLDLARCLTRVSQWRLDGPDPSIALAATGGSTSVIQRVERLIQPSRTPDRWTNSWRQRFLNSLACLIAVGVVWAAPHVASSVERTSGTTPLDAKQQLVNEVVDAITPPADSGWESCNNQLALLARDVQRVEHLLKDPSLDIDLGTSVTTLRRRMDALQRRRARLQKLMEESEATDSDHPATTSN